MANKLVNPYNPDNIDKLLYVKTAKRGKASYRGYKTVYLTQELSAMESDFLSCSMCQGISREAISSEGEILCKLCKQWNSSSNPANKVRNSVANLNVRCPLSRDCGWNGKLVDGEKHLKECGKFFVTCTLECGDVTERCEMSNHLKTECLLREMKCEFCDLVFIFKNLNEHLKTCPAHPIVCKCSRVLRRDAVEEHIDKDCELTEIECPYAKYSCKIGKILRKDLLVHKKEFYIEHQDMLERENCLVTEKLGMYVQKHDLLEGKCYKLIKENTQLVRKHDLLEGTCDELRNENAQLVLKHNLLEGTCDKLREENAQFVQKYNNLVRIMEEKHAESARKLYWLKIMCNELTNKNNELAQRHLLLEGICNDLKKKNTQLVLKHDLLEGDCYILREENAKFVQKYDLSEGERDIFREENAQLVQKYRTMEWNYSKLKQELGIRKKLLGVSIDLDTKYDLIKSCEFSNGQYRFVCNISSTVDGVEISLNRLSTSTYSDKKILCITECVLCLQETTTEILPHYMSERICSRIGTGGYIPIMELDKKMILRYQQSDGIVKIDVYFDYDCITYKGFFS